MIPFYYSFNLASTIHLLHISSYLLVPYKDPGKTLAHLANPGYFPAQAPACDGVSGVPMCVGNTVSGSRRAYMHTCGATHLPSTQST